MLLAASRSLNSRSGESLPAGAPRSREVFLGRLGPWWQPAAVLAAGLLGWAPAEAAAQVNTERLRRSEAADGWSGATTLDVTLRTGNVDLALIGIGGRVDRVAAGTQTFAVVAGDFGWEGGERFSNEGLIHLRQTYWTDRRVSPEVFLQANYDRSRELLFRGLMGAGLRVPLVGGPRWSVVAATAYMFEREHLDVPAGAVHPRRTSAHRWSSYLTSRFTAGDRVALVGTAYVQPRFDDLGDTRILADARMALQLTGRASVTMTLNLRYDSGPPDGVDPVDATWKTGFALEW